MAGEAGDGLRSIDTRAWTGPAAERCHDKFSYEPGRWFTAADAMQAGAGGLDDYVATLRWAQGQAAEAVRQWSAGQVATAQARARYEAVPQTSPFQILARPVAQPRGKRWRMRGNKYVQLLVW